MSVNTTDKKPFAIHNIRLFIRFRIFFNSRFYYPVFTILFLDFGLSLEKFAILNAVWAATIVLFEVPSGALADTFGRRNLLVCTGILMVMEMTLLAFAPRQNSNLLFAVFLVNRIFSGLAEAAASGADEALAYDTLVREGNPDDWSRVLEKQMRFQSIAFIVAMSVGAAVYDPHFMRWFFGLIGMDIYFDRQLTLRLPLFLTLIMAIMTLLTTVQMREVTNRPNEGERREGKSCVKTIAGALRLTAHAGIWIFKTPFALILILFSLVFDHVIRMVMTLCSQYYRLIELPEALFGLIGSVLAVMGLFIPRIAVKLVERRTPGFNLGALSVITFFGLFGMAFFIPYIGLLPIFMLVCAMYMTGLFSSHYLNRITDSHQRATVLSFKGLSSNLAYGLFGMGYALMLSIFRSARADSNPELSQEALQALIFIDSIGWFPWYFIVLLTAVLLYARWQLKLRGSD